MGRLDLIGMGGGRGEKSGKHQQESGDKTHAPPMHRKELLFCRFAAVLLSGFCADSGSNRQKLRGA